MALNIGKLNKPKASSGLKGIGIPKMSEEEKVRFSNEIIDNGGSLERLYQRVDALYGEYSHMQSL